MTEQVTVSSGEENLPTQPVTKLEGLNFSAGQSTKVPPTGSQNENEQSAQVDMMRNEDIYGAYYGQI